MSDICIYENTKYKMAFKEVLVILNNIPKSDYEKIPNDIIETLENNQEHSYNFSLEAGKSIDNQRISDVAKAIIENFYRDYWVTDAERQKILQEEKHKRIKIEEEKKEKYNVYDIFSTNSKSNSNSKSKIEETAVIELRKVKWYNKIITLLKKFFNK